MHKYHDDDFGLQCADKYVKGGINMDTGTTVAICTLIICLMAPIIIDSLGSAGAFSKGKEKGNRKKKIKESEKEK